MGVDRPVTSGTSELDSDLFQRNLCVALEEIMAIEPTNDNPRVLIIVATTGAPPFSEIEQAQVITWIRQVAAGEMFFFEGNSHPRMPALVALLGKFLGWIQMANYKPGKRIVIPRLSDFWALRRPPNAPSHQKKRELRYRVLNFGWKNIFEWFYLRGNLPSRLIQALLYRMWPTTSSSIGHRIRCHFPAHWFMLAPIYLLKYRFISENFDFDYVLFTNVTCYVRPDVLRQRLLRESRTGFYGGHMMNLSGHRFAAGNSIVLSKDVLAEVAHNTHKFRLDLPDDVSLGRLIGDLGIAEFVDLPTEHLPFGARIPDDLSDEWEGAHIIRCKSEATTRNPDPVIELMRALHLFVSKSDV